MIADAFLWVLNRTPSLRRAMWRLFFDVLAARFGNIGWWTLMNYGYAEPEGATGSFDLKPDDEAERYPIALYRHVATLAPIAGRDVLEIGSGRGGGASYIARYLKPRRMVGIDLSGKAVAFSNRRHVIDNLHFRQGDAERLPFDDQSFDAVINVEIFFLLSVDRWVFRRGEARAAARRSPALHRSPAGRRARRLACRDRPIRAGDRLRTQHHDQCSRGIAP